MSRHLLTALVAALAGVLTLLPARAEAFCGFYVAGAGQKMFNDATQVVMMREGTQTILSMQNNYQGPPEDFALVIPVPEILDEERVKVLPDSVFTKIDQLAAPRLVEYWEQNPCQPYGGSPRPAPGAQLVADETTSGRLRARQLGVTVEAEFDVGEYNVVILSARESNGLETWLTENDYNIPEGAAPVLQPYIEQGQYFFVARVDAAKVEFDPKGQTMLSPLRFHYDAEQFALPVRLGLLNARGDQDLIVHILSRQGRYEVANYPNVAIPTNLVVDESVRDRFAEFYTSLFDYTIEQHDKAAVVTEYAWTATKCDPCPTPPLGERELVALGGDVVVGKPGQTELRLSQSLGSLGWTLTRLHARYDIDTLKDDLVFRAAPPIVGGRGMPHGEQGLMRLEGVAPASGPINNFQGRYIMLNFWEGEIVCEDPRRGIWGGPPGGGRPPVHAAQGTAFAERGAVSLSQSIRDKKLLSARLLPSGPHRVELDPPPTAMTPGCGRCAQSGPSGAPEGLAPLALLALLARRRRRA